MTFIEIADPEQERTLTAIEPALIVACPGGANDWAVYALPLDKVPMAGEPIEVGVRYVARKGHKVPESLARKLFTGCPELLGRWYRP